ncbi:MAG: TonB-dependent receptor [Bacteroidota bacterium]
MEISTFKKLIVSILLLLPLASGWAQSAKVTGIIQDASSGEPLIAATVQVGENGATTDVDGRFQLELPAGKHQLLMRYIGYEDLKQTIQVEQGEIKELELQLQPTATILDVATVTSGKYEKPLSEVTVSMEVIKPKLLEATNTTSLDQVLNKVPGVSIIAGQANIRGGSGWSYGAGSRVLLLVDDIPALQADAGFPNWADVPIENAEQIEVVKGAASALYGSSALNGIVNFRTGYAKSEPETQIATFGTVNMSPKDKDKQWWDSPPYQVGMSILHKQKFNKLDVVASAYGLTRNGGVIQNTFNRYARVTLGTRYRISDNFSVGFNSNFNRGKGRSYFYWQGNGENAYIGDSTTESNSNRLRYYIDPFITYFDKSGIRHKFMGRFHRIDNKNDGDQSNGSKLFYGEYQIQKKVESIDLVVTAGLVGIRTNITAELYGDTSYHSNNTAAYLQLEKKFFNKLNLSAGVRYERNQIEGPKNVIVGTEIIPIDETDQTEARPVLRLGANYELTPATFLRASWGQGYRFPTIAEKFISTASGAADILPSPTLESETGWSAEVAVKQGFLLGSGWSGYIDVAAFWSEYNDMMEFRLTQIFPRPAFQSLNVGGTVIKGLEFSLAGQGKIGEVELSALGGYTYIDPKFKEFTEDELYSSSVDYNVLKYRFKHSAKIDIQADFKKFFVGAGYIYNSHIEAVDLVFETIIPGLKDFRWANDSGAHVMDARLGYEVFEGAKASVVVKNLLNNEYMYRPGVLSAPRNVTFRLEYSF